ncbi:MAG: DUF5615 family PIN-like protein [Chloroflexota bacterium]
MTGLGILLYTDEDVDVHLAEQLRRSGYDVVSCREAGNSSHGYSDEWQLSYATREGRAILVHNISHFVPIDVAWKTAGRLHFGIIAVPQSTSLSELVRRVKVHLDTVGPKQQHNLLRYLLR